MSVSPSGLEPVCLEPVEDGELVSPPTTYGFDDLSTSTAPCDMEGGV